MKSNKDPYKCKHLVLHFETGGYQVVCNECGYKWAGTLNDALDYKAMLMGLSEFDIRKDRFTP